MMLWTVERKSEGRRRPCPVRRTSHTSRKRWKTLLAGVEAFGGLEVPPLIR